MTTMTKKVKMVNVHLKRCKIEDKVDNGKKQDKTEKEYREKKKN